MMMAAFHGKTHWPYNFECFPDLVVSGASIMGDQTSPYRGQHPLPCWRGHSRPHTDCPQEPLQICMQYGHLSRSCQSLCEAVEEMMVSSHHVGTLWAFSGNLVGPELAGTDSWGLLWLPFAAFCSTPCHRSRGTWPSCLCPSCRVVPEFVLHLQKVRNLSVCLSNKLHCLNKERVGWTAFHAWTVDGKQHYNHTTVLAKRAFIKCVMMKALWPETVVWL